jgi:hypothetical protein
MATSACIKVVATSSEKLTVSLVVFATKYQFERVNIRWILTRNIFAIA